MKRLKISTTVLAALLLGAPATSAFALLPTLSALAYPLHLNFVDNGATELKWETTAGSKLEGKGVSLLLIATALSESGTFRLSFLQVKLGTTSCNTEGDAAGEVLFTAGEYHLVYPSLSPLTLGLAFSVGEITSTCGTLKINLRGCLLASVTDPKAESAEVGLATAEVTGAKGKNTLTKFYNAEGTGTVECKVEANFGTGYLQSDFVIGEPLHLVALESGMFKISPI